MVKHVLLATLLAVPLTAHANPDVVAVGASLPGVLGTDEGANGDLWAGSIGNHAIFRISPNGAVQTFDDTSTIDDVIYASTGYVYGTALFKGEVIRLDPATGAISTVASGLAFPNPIVELGDGDLVVGGGAPGVPASCYLKRIDPNGVNPPADVVPLGTLCPNSMDVMADGRLLIPDWNLSHDLLAVDPVTGAVEILATGLVSPVSAKVCDGRKYVLDQRADGDDGGEIFEHTAGGLSSVAVTGPNTDSISCYGGNLLITSVEGGVRLVAGGRTWPMTLEGQVLAGGVVIDGNRIHSSGFFASRLVHETFGGGFYFPRPSETVHGGFENAHPPYGFLNQDISGNLIGGSFIAGRVSTMDPATGVAVGMTLGGGIVNQVVDPTTGDVYQALMASPVSGAMILNATTGIPVATTPAPTGLGFLSDGRWFYTDIVLGTLNVEGLAPVEICATPEGATVTDDDTIIVLCVSSGDMVEYDPATGSVTTLATGTFFDAVPGPTEFLPPQWLSVLSAGVDGCDVYAWGFEQSAHTWVPSWKLYRVDRC